MAIKATQTLDAVIRKAMLQSQAPESKYKVWLEYAIDGLRELRLFTTKEGVQFKDLEPDAINCIYYPNDCEEVVGVNVVKDGGLVPLLNKRDMVMPASEELSDEETSSYSFAYRDEPEQRRIRVEIGASYASVKLAYITSGVIGAHETLVPSKHIPALMAFIIWSDARYAIGLEKRASYLETQWEKERSKLKYSEAMPSLEELKQTFHSTYGLINIPNYR